jgi:hypothetical protein
MPYNISNWKVKRLSNLKVPLPSFYKHPRTEWHPYEEYDRKTGKLLLHKMGTEITGTIDNDDVLSVESIECYGEGSGTVMEFIIEPALKDSTGKLDVVMVWEGGDSIQRMVCSNGKIKWEEIEL